MHNLCTIKELSTKITKIILPTRPQPDTAVAIFLLKKFGLDTYPGINSAEVCVDPVAKESEDAVLIDVGGGTLDHHGTGKCATELVAHNLNIQNDLALKKLIAYARRDDTVGKGTISKDPLDRAFGLSGLIASLNKQLPQSPDTIINIVRPLLEAHYFSGNEHFNVLPKEVGVLEENGNFSSIVVDTPMRNLKIAFVQSDNPSMVSYLRSGDGGGYRIVVQGKSTGHVNILTKQNPKLNLAKTAALIRLYETEIREHTVPSEDSLYTTGFHKEIPNWYYDTATNSILNGGVTPDKIEATKIPWEDMKKIITYGIKNTVIEK